VAGFNFFKIYNTQKGNLAKLLTSKGMPLFEKKTVVEGGNSYEYELYYSAAPRSRPVKWVKELQKKFPVPDANLESYSAAIIISFKSNVYAISFGSAHFYISIYSDFEFGISIASKILDTFKIKNSREFSGIKTKSIETYLEAKDLFYDAGEAVNFIKGIPENKDLWGKNVSCGQSVFLRKRDFTVTNIHRICEQLEHALTLPSKKEIPRSIPIKDRATKIQLETQLTNDIKSGNYMISISQQQLSGVAFLFSDQYEYQLTVGKNTFELDEKTKLNDVDSIVQSFYAGDYSKLLRAEVTAYEDGKVVFQKRFMNFLDYIDSQNHYFIEDGEWYKFDDIYLSNVRNEVNKIDLSHSSEIHRFDEVQYQTWLTLQPNGKKYYRERYLNEVIMTSFGYVNHDRSFSLFEGATVEIADLVKNDTIYIVKLGTAQKLGYAIDQATAALRVLERNKFTVQVAGQDVKINRVCLWLFFERANAITSLTDINSLIFLMKISQWRKATLISGLQASVCISYK
jgi:uncharacterized protein (TIGR04141 family)